MSESGTQPIRSHVGADGPDAELRSLLEASDGHEPSPADLASLGKRLAEALPPGTLPPGGDGTPSGGGAGGAPTAAPPTTAPTGGILSSAGAKLLAAIAIGGAIAGVVAVVPREPSPSAVSPAPTVTARAPEGSLASPVASVAAVPSTSSSAGAAVIPEPSTAAAPPRPSTAAPSEPEATILARAHDELLRGAPEKALATTNEHTRGYPKGALAQEREVIAIEALVRLGRRDESRRRAQAFHRVYVGSSHGDRVDRLVDGP